MAKSKIAGFTRVPCGLHLATITAIYYARKGNGEYLAKQDTGEMALTIEFETSKGVVSHNFWETSAAEWTFRKLYTAIGRKYDPKKPAHVDEVIGNRLWIIVAQIINREDGIETEGGTELTMNFYPFTTLELKPRVGGNPDDNEGKPSDSFVIYNDILT